eukprot:scpid93439/ scgid6722/ 
MSLSLSLSLAQACSHITPWCQQGQLQLRNCYMLALLRQLTAHKWLGKRLPASGPASTNALHACSSGLSVYLSPALPPPLARIYTKMIVSMSCEREAFLPSLSLTLLNSNSD